MRIYILGENTLRQNPFDILGTEAVSKTLPIQKLSNITEKFLNIVMRKWWSIFTERVTVAKIWNNKIRGKVGEISTTRWKKMGSIWCCLLFQTWQERERSDDLSLSVCPESYFLYFNIGWLKKIFDLINVEGQSGWRHNFEYRHSIFTVEKFRMNTVTICNLRGRWPALVREFSALIGSSVGGLDTAELASKGSRL